MTPHLLVEDCGAATSLQDAGRFRQQRFGVSPAGAMDRFALALANALVGNAPGEAAIEFALLGGRLRAEGGPVRIALAGAECPLLVDGAAVAPLTAITVAGGQAIEIRPARKGAFAYLAIGSGLAVPPVLGSRALHLRSQMGGIAGRPLRPGDRLPVNRAAQDAPAVTLTLPPAAGDPPIRVMLGPQDDLFDPQGIADFLGSPYTVTAEADRMGYRLEGAPIRHRDGYNIVSDGIVSGSIQVPGAGQPIVLLADRQTTGGYPKIATVISADLPLLVQKRPGDRLHFAAVNRTEAVMALRARLDELAAAAASIGPAGARGFDSARLLSLNLVDGWLDALA